MKTVTDCPGRARLDGVDFGGDLRARRPSGVRQRRLHGRPRRAGVGAARQVLHRGDPGRTRTVQPSGPHEAAKHATKVHMQMMRPTPSMWLMAPVVEAGGKEGGRGDLHRRHDAAAHVEQRPCGRPCEQRNPESLKPLRNVENPLIPRHPVKPSKSPNTLQTPVKPLGRSRNPSRAELVQARCPCWPRAAWPRLHTEHQHADLSTRAMAMTVAARLTELVMAEEAREAATPMPTIWNVVVA